MKKYLILLIVLLFIPCSIVLGGPSVESKVSIDLIKQGLIIGTPANIHLGSVSAGQSISQNFTGDNYFWIEDLRGLEHGHYTTIHCDGLYQINGTGVITGVQLMRGNTQTGILIGGIANGTTIDSHLRNWTDITYPVLYFYRNDNEHNGGAVNRYGSLPSIKINVPSNTPAGTYKGKISYTLYDMPFLYY